MNDSRLLIGFLHIPLGKQNKNYEEKKEKRNAADPGRC